VVLVAVVIHSHTPEAAVQVVLAEHPLCLTALAQVVLVAYPQLLVLQLTTLAAVAVVF
jgi:hypothetical protein